MNAPLRFQAVTGQNEFGNEASETLKRALMVPAAAVMEVELRPTTKELQSHE